MGIIKGSNILITMLSLAVIGQAGYYSYSVEELENNINHVEDEKKQLEQEQIDNLAENISLSEELEKLEKGYRANEETIQEYEQRIEQLQSDIKAREEKINSLNSTVEKESSQEPVSVVKNDESSDKSEVLSKQESLNDNIPEVSKNEENDNSSNDSSGQTFQTTYYSAYDGAQIGVTATGVSMANGNIHNENGERIVAVDPDVIPLGTTLKVVTDKGESFIASAEDSGGLIKGNRIDIAVSNPEEAMALGRGTAKVEIIG